jgi:hypothetical protein
MISHPTRIATAVTRLAMGRRTIAAIYSPRDGKKGLDTPILTPFSRLGIEARMSDLSGR